MNTPAKTVDHNSQLLTRSGSILYKYIAMTYSKYNIVLIFILLAVSSYYCKPPDDWKQGILVEEFIYEEAPFPSCHAATIAETERGLIAAWFGGTRERHPDVGIWISRRENGEWSTPVEVANGVVGDSTRYPTWNPVLYQVPEGDLMLFYKVGPSPSTWWGMMKKSEDGGLNWTDAIPLPEGFLGPIKNKPVLLDDGKLLCGSSTEGDAWRIHMEYTTDFGKSWDKTGPLNDGRTFQAIQPTILTHSDGSLQILCRSKNASIVESWSPDDGNSWSLLQESGLPNNNSGLDGVSLSDGRHLLVYNHVKTPENARKGYRTPLNLAISKDGKNWYAAGILEDSEISQYSYPAVIQSRDGMVHIVYTWRRERIKYIQLDPARLRLKKIKNGKWPQ
jgi:alpha-L-rhamnosidase